MKKSLTLKSRQLFDLEMLLNGGFSPLTGFMKKNDYESCLTTMRLENGKLFPLPIILSIPISRINEIKNEKVLLLKDETGVILAELKNEQIYEPDLLAECRYALGTEDSNHPYYDIIMENKNCFYIGGEVTKVQLPLHYDFKEYRLTPEETKKFFKDNNWKNVIGFQTRNPLHRSHYELTLNALKEVGEDAKLLLHPVVGITQECDIDYFTRVRCYKKLINKYPKNTVLLSLLPLSMRMAGPREALWHALIRKNYGCTHFIVGRDHAGPSYKTKDGKPFYDPYDAHKLLLKYENELNIKIILSQNIVYVKELGKFKKENEVDKNMTILNISGTEQREILRNSTTEIPEWFSWPDIIEELRTEYKLLSNSGLCIYIVGLSGSGKSTLANVLISKLKELETKRKITLLDADIVRLNLSKGLGFSKEDRSTNVRRIGYVASEIVKHSGIVICANIAPYEEDRLHNRKLISQYGKYIEVYMNTSIECCERRDVKGLYKLAKEGKMKEMTGIDDPFEIPNNSELILDGDENNNNSSLEYNLNKLIEIIYNL
jgi:sulfate adenylyltransferase